MFSDCAWRNRIHRQLVVDRDSQSECLSSFDLIRNVDVERRVAANVVTNKLVIYVNLRRMCCCIEPYDDSLISPSAWNANLSLVINPTNMITYRGIGKLVVITCGHGYFEFCFERVFPRCLWNLGISCEGPQAVEQYLLASAGNLGFKHVSS